MVCNSFFAKYFELGSLHSPNRHCQHAKRDRDCNQAQRDRVRPGCNLRHAIDGLPKRLPKPAIYSYSGWYWEYWSHVDTSPQIGTLLVTNGTSAVYTAPSTISSTTTVEVDGVSVADSTKVAKAIITLVPLLVSLTPATADVSGGQTQQFTTGITGTSNQGVTWSIQPGVGTIDSNGLYTAPPTVLTAQNVTVTAQSIVAQTSRATAQVVLSPPPILAPTSVSLTAGQTQLFAVTNAVTGNGMDANWSLNPPVGTISNSGKYQAPAVIPSAQTITITASKPNYTSVSGTINLIPVGVTLAPSAVSLVAAQSQQVTAVVTGTSNGAITWSLSPNVGTISSSGLYTAPALIPSAQNVAITATSVADSTKSATVSASLNPVAVTMSPPTVSLTQSQTQALTASVTGSTNTGVTWSTPSTGTLVTNGNTAVYASPSTISSSQSVSITATSMADSTKSASATISLASAVVISIAPAVVSLNAGLTQQFTASINGTSNTAVTWSLNPAVGTIDSTGLYTTPPTVLMAQNVTVTAQSVADPTKTASSTVSVQPGLQWSIDKNRLTSLSYGGQSFYQFVSSIVQGAVFRTPTGTTYDAGWSNPSTSTLVAPNAFQEVYNLGQSYQFTLLVTWTQTDSRTLKAVAQVTNNDPVNTLVTLNLHTLSINLPGPANQYNQNIPLEVNQYNGVPVTFLNGAWGSVALWQSGYPTAGEQLSSYNSATQTSFMNILTTSTTYGPRTYSLETPPGQTNTLTQFIRFGSTTDSATSLAPEAYAEYRTAFPDLVNWPNRHPIAMWMISNGGSGSATNPRGYLWDPTIDITNAANFQSSVISATNNTVGLLNRMAVHPQGVIIWDLEGQEFIQPFTYVGYPSNLPNLAPEMDAIADTVMSMLKQAGYRVGVTVRPNHFGTGTTLPSTCVTDPNYNLWDKFILLSASFPYRGYVCSATNVWQVSRANGPAAQTTTQDYNATLSLLQQKISYAHSRWGATLFYIDSSVWEGGTPIDVSIIRTLATQFPDSLLIPEIVNSAYFGPSAPYNAKGGNMNIALSARSLYPGAFQVFNVADVDTTTYQNTLVQMVQAGDILMFRGWWSSPEIPAVQRIYNLAGVP